MDVVGAVVLAVDGVGPVDVEDPAGVESSSQGQRGSAVVAAGVEAFVDDRVDLADVELASDRGLDVPVVVGLADGVILDGAVFVGLLVAGVDTPVVCCWSLGPFAGAEHSAGLLYPSQSSSFHVPAG